MLVPSSKRIRSIAPSITDKEIALVTEAVSDGWFDNMSMHLDQFVEEMKAFTGSQYCLPLSHGTAAVHLALLAANVQATDEVIVPDITWVASASPILHLGATPVFVDIDPATWCICPTAFEQAITHKTKAVICVDLFGSMPDFARISTIAKQHNIMVIEDAAEGIGSEYQGCPAGTLGDIGIFSFNATKLIMGGQGGMLVTSNNAIYERAKLLSHHGIDTQKSGKYYWSTELGHNYNWSNLNAALALAQLRRITELVAQKRQIFAWYARELQDCPHVTLNAQPDDVYNCYWITCAVLSPVLKLEKEEIKKQFDAFNIDVRPFFYPLTMMPPFAPFSHSAAANRTSYQLSPRAICLPSGYDLVEEDVVFVSQVLKQIIDHAESN